jgi:transposase/bacterioferritin-associated ferredoxin
MTAPIDPALLPANAQICSCNNVTKGDLTEAIAGGCCDVPELKKCTLAGTSCGSWQVAQPSVRYTCRPRAIGSVATGSGVQLVATRTTARLQRHRSRPIMRRVPENASLNDVTVVLDDRPILRGISLELAPGLTDTAQPRYGMTEEEIAAVTETLRSGWLTSGPRGPEPGTGRLLDAGRESEARDLIRRHTPDELGLPFVLWSRPAVRELILRRFGVRLAVRTMGSYLARWGFTAQKPLRRAYEQDPAAVRRWLRQDYPAIVARAKAGGGAIFWGDETGLRSDAVRGLSYAPRGRTPTVRVPHKRAGLGLLSAVTNKGELRWMVLDGAVKAPSLLRFLARLVRDAGRKVFLILDRLPVHRSAPVRVWLAERTAEMLSPPSRTRTGSEPHIPMRHPDSMGTWLASAMSRSLSPTLASTVGPGSKVTETSPA